MTPLFPPYRPRPRILRDYQSAAVQAVIRNLNRRPILVAPTGAGKTVMASALVAELGAPTLWLAHRTELIEQAARSLAPLRVGIIKAGCEPTPGALVQVASVQTLVRREKPPAEIIIVDECFPAGTLIDGRRIETMKVGDSVRAWCAFTNTIQDGKVTRLFRRKYRSALIRIRAGGRTVVCTPRHPFLTENGWRIAESLDVGDTLYAVPEMQCDDDRQRETVPTMLSGGNGGTESALCSRENASTQSDGDTGSARADDANNPGPWTSPSDPRRKRQAAADSPQDACRCAESSDRSGDTRGHGAEQRIPDLLQAGHCGHDPQDSERQKERCVPVVARVDSVEILERIGNGESDGLCPDGYVYNLEVAGFHNYSANGLIVHNCHHSTAGQYREILDAYPRAAVVGLTATPFRLDGKGLGDIFGEIIVSAYTDDLVSQGWLHAPKVFAGSVPDLRGVKKTAGDYNIQQLADRMRGANVADIPATWRKRADGRRTVCFAVNVEHSQEIVAALQAEGIAAEHIDGTTPPDLRRATLARLASGETRVVSNCMVLTEGWDLPSLECAIIARPTASLNLHLQMIGRIMRVCDDKAGAVVLDHAGNHHVHGLVTRRLNYSLAGKVAGEVEQLGLRQCPMCKLLYSPTLKACPECGYAPPVAEREKPNIHGDGELTEYREDFAYRREIWNLIEAERESMGFKEGWSLFRYKERFGAFPLFAENDDRRELVDPNNATREQKESVYARFLSFARERGMADGWASHKYREAFGVWPSGFVGRAKATRENIAAKWAARTAEATA